MLGGSQTTISGANGNTVEENGAFGSAMGGGMQNSINALSRDGAEYSVLGGGALNLVTGAMSALSGGENNTTSGYLSCIPGGLENTASVELSFAAGTSAQADTAGSFVWGDQYTGAFVSATKPNEFLVRSTGGVTFYSNASMTTGVTLPPGSGAWSSTSDRNVKIDASPINGGEILHRVLTLPVTQWKYRSEPHVDHVGPMAQDFFTHFGVGEDDRHISTVDEDGVLLAAVKQLALEYETIAARHRTLRAQVSELELSGERLAREAQELCHCEISLRARSAQT
jgi:hypothetical protein